ncbi:MAG: phosphodiester glycosidase family protein, partial [Clostridia bacterium]|nr:phosphodiester glycosidase family protein [Clostridia bacterium]
ERHMQLAPGITQDTVAAYDSDGHRQEYYVATADLSVDTVRIETNYKDHQCSERGVQELEKQCAAAEADHSDPYSVIAATNASFFDMSNGQVYGVLVMNGVDASQYRICDPTPSYHGFFAILNDGTPVIGDANDYARYRGNIYQAVSGFGVVLRDGEPMYENSPGRIMPRTFIGITQDHKVKMVAVDGRDPAKRYGVDAYTGAMMMKSLGCVDVLGLDTGGSTGFYSRYPGEETGRMRNKPSDGKSRKISASIMMVSTAEADGSFDSARLDSDYNFLTPGTSLKITAAGSDSSGAPAALPSSGLTWSVSDSSLASITQDGTVTAKYSASGAFNVELMYNGSIVGSKELEVVIPDNFDFTQQQITVAYGSTTEIPFEATYKLVPVAINSNDFFAINEYEYDFKVTEEKWDLYGTFDGKLFTAPDESIGIRNEKLYAVSAYAESEDEIRSIEVEFYKEGEDYFDYSNADCSNDCIAWNRDVNGAALVSRDEGDTYLRDSASSDVTVDYTYALDVSKVQVPDYLAPLWESFSGALGDTAWSAFLSIANKIDQSTYIMATFNIDDRFVVTDLENINLKGNEMFYIGDDCVEYDVESNRLTIKFMWNKPYVDSLSSSAGGISEETVRNTAIVQGLRLKLKNGAVFDEENNIDYVTCASLYYCFIIFSNSAYQVANREGLSELTLMLYNPATGSEDRAVKFASTYSEFTDSFTLKNAAASGLTVGADGYYYYYDDANEPVKGGRHYLSNTNSLAETGYYDIMEDGRVVLSSSEGGLISYSAFNDIPGAHYLPSGSKAATGMSASALTGGALTHYTVFIPGDVNCDGLIDAQDAVILRCVTAGMAIDSTPAIAAAGDANSDGKTDIEDSDYAESGGIFT